MSLRSATWIVALSALWFSINCDAKIDNHRTSAIGLHLDI